MDDASGPSLVNPQLSAIGQVLLRRVPAMVDRGYGWAGNFPGYRTDGVEDLRRTGEPAIRHLVTSVYIEQRHPTDADHAMAKLLARQRAAAGIPAASLLRVINGWVQELWQAAAVAAEETEAAPEALVTAGSLLIEWANAFTSDLVATYGDFEREQVRAREERRARFVHGLMTATASAEDMLDFGLDPRQPYIPFRARGPHASSIGAEAAVAAPMSGDTAGVFAVVPTVIGKDVCVGLGDAAEPSALSAPFATAARALNAAVAFGLRGAFTIDDLGLRVAIAAEPGLGASLVARYLGPLAHEGGQGEILERTLATWFEHKMKVEAAAHVLGIHANTMRYRLGRYQALAGIDLDDAEHIAGLWWALQHRRVDHQAATALAHHMDDSRKFDLTSP